MNNKQYYYYENDYCQYFFLGLSFLGCTGLGIGITLALITSAKVPFIASFRNIDTI